MFTNDISFNSIVIILLLATVANHGLIVLSDAVYWDGWLIRGWYRQNDFATHKISTWENGLPIYYYIDRIMAMLPNPFFLYKLFSLVCIFSVSLTIYGICLISGFFSCFESLAIALLCLCYPGQDYIVEPSMITPYVFTPPFFFLACLLGILAQDYSGLESSILHLSATVCFLISFNMHSLMVFYAGFVSGLFLINLHRESFSFSSAFFLNMLSQGYYFLLPFIYWLWKQKYFPRKGHYADYNKISLCFKGIRNLPSAFLQMIKTGAGGVFMHSIFFSLRHPLIFIFASISSISFFLVQNNFLIPLKTSPSNFAGTFFFGIFLLICGGIPYILVGQKFGLRGWETKNNSLLPFPAALILISFFKLMLPLHIIAPVIVFLLICFCISNNYNHLRLIAVYAKNLSFLFKLKGIPNAKSFSIFSVCDFHPIRFPSLGQPEHRPAYLIYMLEFIWNDITRIGIYEENPRQKEYSFEEINSIKSKTTIDYALNNINTNGTQASLIVLPGTLNVSDAVVGLKYIIYRLVNRQKFNALIKNLTRVKLDSFHTASDSASGFQKTSSGTYLESSLTS